MILINKHRIEKRTFEAKSSLNSSLKGLSNLNTRIKDVYFNYKENLNKLFILKGLSNSYYMKFGSRLKGEKNGR